MSSANGPLVFLLVCCMLQLTWSVDGPDQIEMDCVPTIRHRFDVCPTGYCCVRDEFLASYVYCKKIGKLDDNCTTRETESECPCADGLYCRANILGAFPSVYGKCAVDPNVTTTVSGASVIG